MSFVPRDALDRVSLATTLFRRGLSAPTVQDTQPVGIVPRQHGRFGLHAAHHLGLGGQRRPRSGPRSPHPQQVAIKTNVPVACSDALFFRGDVLVGHVPGVVFLPAGIADEMNDSEAFVIEEVHASAGIVGLYPRTTEGAERCYATWRERNAQTRGN